MTTYREIAARRESYRQRCKERAPIARELIDRMCELHPVTVPLKYPDNDKKQGRLLARAIANRRIARDEVMTKWDWFDWVYQDARRQHAWERMRLPAAEVEALLLLLFGDAEGRY